MSEQSKILEALEELIMEILKSGSASAEQGSRLDSLEAKLFGQKSFIAVESAEHSCQGEEIASLFFNHKTTEAIQKMSEYSIIPEDFFGFAQYHYDEDEDEKSMEMFTDAFMAEVSKAYEEK